MTHPERGEVYLVRLPDCHTSVSGGGAQLATGLLGNSPNPFNPATSIRYSMLTEGYVSILVYSVRGRLIRTLIDAHQASGIYTVTWDGTDSQGRPVASGVYFYRLTSNGQSETRRMVLVR